MTDIRITKINESFIKVLCSETHMELDIQDRFTFEVPNARFDPRVKRGVWDGMKKLFNRRDKKLPIGLLFELIKLCNNRSWTYDLDERLLPNEDPLDHSDVQEIIDDVIKPHSNGNPIEPFDYQIEAVLYQLNMDKSICLAATSSGKSLIIYMAVRIYQLMEEMQDKTIFITVPNVSLVEQLYSDFEDYSAFEGSDWHVNKYCQKVSGKHSKHIDRQIVITTWQSMQKLPLDVFEGIGAIFVDEVHSAAAKVLGGLIEQATNTPFKHGLTGTLDGCESNEMYIEGLFNPPKRIVTSQEIIEAGRASDIQINMMLLNHPERERKNLHDIKGTLPSSKKYQQEIDFISKCDYRKDFIFEMLNELEGNTLVLFNLVEDYGKPLYEEYKENNPETTFFITGDVDSNEREEIRLGMEEHDKSVLFASYGTMSTGISIKKLHNLVLISSSKSKIRTLQSIGRLMRKHSSKEKANIFDLVDNLEYRKKNNYLLNHAKERLDFYQNEKFNIEYLEFDLKST